jgi:UDP-N-acetylmuramoylalanine--D-glutamate ligase
VAGLRSFEEPVVLLLGGRDKHLPLKELATLALQRCRGIVLFGEFAGALEEALHQAPNLSGAHVARAQTLDEAVAAARGMAQQGDVVLLSPAGTSYDAYENFERRGEHFRALVTKLAREAQPSRR